MEQEAIASLCARPPEQRLDAAASSWRGLSRAEAARRLAAYGANTIPRAARGSPRWALVANFIHPLALLLWFGATMALAAGAPQLATAIAWVVVINGVFARLQEYRAERVVEALLRRAALSARVVRDGVTGSVPAAELVAGDLIVLGAGDVVPADGVLVRADGLSLDLSMLTGETTPVTKTEVIDARDGATAISRACFAPAGAGVLRGSATAVVVATGAASTLGKVEALLASPVRGESVLERQVAQLSRLTAVLAVACGLATLTLAIWLRGIDVVTALMFATGVIVALVPEGLLPLLTVSLSLAARRMATRGALIRRLAAVEIVGASTVICTDKTGTLTQNAVAVRGFVAARGAMDADHRAGLIATLCNDARDDTGPGAGDPIDRAMLAWARREHRVPEDDRRRHPRIRATPFDPERRYASVECATPRGLRRLVKGAPEAVAVLVGAPMPADLQASVDEAARRGDRVLLLAEGPAEGPLEHVGVVQLADPPRPEVPAAIAACRDAGIRVIMLTGDHPATARSIAVKVGLAASDAEVIEGAMLDGLDDRALVARLREGCILARTSPAQKLRVVRVLRAAEEIVTVTGDGVNDAPALRAADVGIAMGQRGTDVAKEASDIVLLDDNFATIVAAIEEGRAIKHNIRRFASYVFTSNVAELVPFLFYIFLPIPLPLTILQVLAIDLGTDLIPALALGTEPPSADVLRTPPESPATPLLTRALALRTFLFFGLLEAALGMVAFLAVFWSLGWRPFAELAPFEAAASAGATLTFFGIVGGQLGCLFAQREGSLGARVSLRRNPWIAIGVAVELAVVIALAYVPAVGAMFGMVPVPVSWLLVIPIAAAIMLGADLIRRRLRGAAWFEPCTADECVRADRTARGARRSPSESR